ncbi:MAG: hypothetical protein QM270_06485 [Bacillota bacterium]|nr:hypothetical protein [Bacillota bacterium]
MKRRIAAVIIVFLFLPLCACGEKSGEGPVTAVALGSTLKQAMKLEPALGSYKEHQYTCSKNYEGAEGTLLIYCTALADEETVTSILWTAQPTGGNGKAVYDTLFSVLRKLHGKPGRCSDEKDVEALVGVYSEAQAQWQLTDCTVRCSYIEYRDSGLCEIQYALRSSHSFH